MPLQGVSLQAWLFDEARLLAVKRQGGCGVAHPKTLSPAPQTLPSRATATQCCSAPHRHRHHAQNRVGVAGMG
eukprot:3142973-Rhodomonas_salina.1